MTKFDELVKQFERAKPPSFSDLVKAFENVPQSGALTIDGNEASIDSVEHRIDIGIEVFAKLIKQFEK